VAGDVDALIEAGNDALRGADWSAAEGSFRAALDVVESGEAEFGLGIARWWSGEAGDALRCWERAYAAVRDAADPVQAVFAAVYLCLAYRMSFGNDAAARGWLERAAAYVDEFGLEEMSGWVLLCRAYVANDAHKPQQAEAYARGALAVARAGGNADLALCATSELGAALIGCGDVDEGGALLDQAMAGPLAGETDLDGVVLISCRTISSCARVPTDIKRAIQWFARQTISLSVTARRTS